MGGRKYTDAQRREMVQRYIDGETMKAIAQDIGCSIPTVSDTVNKHFRGELRATSKTERNDTMTTEKKEKTTEVKETTAAAGTATDGKDKDVTSTYDPYTYNYTAEMKFCQGLLVQIIELAEDIIGDDGADAEVSGYAGVIKGLAVAMREVLRA